MKNMSIAKAIAADLFKYLLKHAIAPAIESEIEHLHELTFASSSGVDVDLEVRGKLSVFGYESDFDFHIKSQGIAENKDNAVDVAEIEAHLIRHFIHLGKIVNGELHIVGKISYHGISVNVDFHI